MSGNFLCIHGHFYQPPRENPWLEVIEYQPSAFPYHDWNERVTRECYGPNTRARLEADEGRILKLVNNYAYMNFDFGPTLLSWLEKAHPWIYQEILAADRISRGRYHGHGNAMAQVYNHLIMPLATTRDKRTQIRWGLADFAARFGRPAEGMWLAETAVDLESLALMAEEGIRFTVLAPTQAVAVRALGDAAGTWKDVSGGDIDTTKPYRVFPRGGESPFIDVFFFDRELSRAVAYEKILSSGSDFLGRLETGIGAEREGACLVNIATDGESYGHHFKFGDMALAWIFDHLEQ
ncbi:MAG: glycoside hydrolase, partial [Deltaproteobacteria bacterium]|nr:glycoside hydrolase [Deltaproteobacteria bacterium]